MKNVLLIALFIFSSLNVLASIPYEKCSKKPSFQMFYDGYIRTEQKLFIPLGFTNSEIISQKDKNLLKTSEVVSVDLVFSNFPEGGIYEDLNKARLKQFEKHFPDLAKNEFLSWRFVAVGRKLTENSAKTMFHGFVITYREKASMKMMSLGSKQLTSFDYSLVKEESSVYKNNIFTKVFQRNKFENEKIACDITGSMYPYSLQLFIWLSLQQKNNPEGRFLFFNDGDNKRIKPIGNSGGLYLSGFKVKLDSVIQTATFAMRKGCGGDAPENNIEALLHLQSKFPKANKLILVADNWAPIKDKVLIPKLTKPVKVILCGTMGTYVNIDYLNLALKTKGSLHTMEQDISDLDKLQPGAIISVLGKRYRRTSEGFAKI